MVGRTLKMAFWLFHDHLGTLLAANLIWAVALAVPISIGVPAFISGDARLMFLVGAPAIFVAFFVLSPLVCTGIAHLVKTCIDTRDGSLSDFFTGMWKYALRSVGAGVVYGVVMIALLTSAWFYATRLHATAPIVGYALSGLALGSAAVLGAMALLLPAAIVQRKTGVFATLRLTLLLVLANPLWMLGVSLQCLFLTVLSVFFVPLFFAGYASAVVCAGSAAYELLARKYAVDREQDDLQDDYLNRGLRDLFFPWKG